MRRLFAMAVIVTVVLSACSGNAGDDPIPVEPDGGIGDGAEPLPPGSPYPVADLTFTIEHPDAETVEYRVTCLGDTATITGVDSLSGEVACSRLAEPAVQARLVSPPAPGDRVCTEIYGGPDTARIDGTLDDEPIATTIDRTDGCGISDWDNLLAGVLPAALGVTE